MEGYVNREELIEAVNREFEGVCVYDVAPSEAVSDFERIIDSVENTDVVAREDVEEAVGETLRILDAIHGSGRMGYGDYCELHDAISAIV